MANLIKTVFGTAKGVNGVLCPNDNVLHQELAIHLDTPMPFQINEIVCRYFKMVDGSGKSYTLAAIYTYISDFDGHREGSFAGAGVFIRGLTLNPELLYSYLTESLRHLLKNATNKIDAFNRPIDSAIDPKDLENLISYQGLVDSIREVNNEEKFLKSPKRVLVSFNDNQINNAVDFFKFCFDNHAILTNDTYYSDSINFHNACKKNIDLYALDVKSISSSFKQEIINLKESNSKLASEVKNKESENNSLLKELNLFEQRGKKFTLDLENLSKNLTFKDEQIENFLNENKSLRQKNIELQNQIEKNKQKNRNLDRSSDRNLNKNESFNSQTLPLNLNSHNKSVISQFTFINLLVLVFSIGTFILLFYQMIMSNNDEVSNSLKKLNNIENLLSENINNQNEKIISETREIKIILNNNLVRKNNQNQDATKLDENSIPKEQKKSQKNQQNHQIN